MTTKSKLEKAVDLLQYEVNRLGYRAGVNVFPKAWPPEVEGPERASVFDAIFHNNIWRSAESRSGPGSELSKTRAYREALDALIRRRGLFRFFDAPCGDLAWMSVLLQELPMEYIGGDISPSLVESVRSSRPSLDIRVFDICQDSFPEADVWHCRDCFFHLPFADIRTALENFVQSRIPWALLTSHRGRWHRNLDVAAGGYRLLDLCRPPLSLPEPEEQLQDYRRGKDFPRFVGLWSREAIAGSLRK